MLVISQWLDTLDFLYHLYKFYFFYQIVILFPVSVASLLSGEKNEVYADSILEKEVRGRLKSEVIRSVEFIIEYREYRNTHLPRFLNFESWNLQVCLFFIFSHFFNVKSTFSIYMRKLVIIIDFFFELAH